ncbi:Uncharacterised protein [Acinetobacter baumannii]|nr:Uncharacterised protein [Acinetobacter baumannii]
MDELLLVLLQNKIFLTNTWSKMLKIMNLRQCLSVFWPMNQACHMSCAVQSLIRQCGPWWATQRM